ncbi:MAG: DUF4292 domain-containing protein [Bacteroidales bacterium]|jgi:hypothetical protein|nr:DUF4292 domain-containing protein [Bacteroidales bacterium]
MKKLKFIIIAIFVSISYSLTAQDSTADILPKELPYQWISYQAKIDFSFEKNTQHCQLFFVNRIDSIMYLHLSFSGIELGRMVLTPDSVFFVNKIEGSYYRGDYALLRNLLMLNLDFYMTQAIFNGIDFPKHNSYFHHEINRNKSNLIVENRFEDLITQNWAIVSYDGYADMDSLPFFNSLAIKLEEKQFELKAALRKVRFNVIGPTGITIPDKFSEIKFD